MPDTELCPPSPAPRFIETPPAPPVPPPTRPAGEPPPAPLFELRPGAVDIVPPRPLPNVSDAPVIETPPPPVAQSSVSCPESDTPPAASGLLRLAGWIAVLVTLLWVGGVSAPFLANALTLHGWRCAVSIFLGLLPVALAAGLLGAVLWRFRRLPAITQVREADFADPATLCARLRGVYLASFPDSERYADINGFADTPDRDSRTLLVACLNRLQGKTPGRYGSSASWIADFKQFQAYQGERAGEIVRLAATFVGVKTAASPWKIVDMLAVLHQSSRMIAALASLYNRRVDSRQAFRLACRWFVNLYVAGAAGDTAQYVVERSTAADWISAAWKPAAHVAGKFAEGAANAFLVWRLGKRAIAAFQPLVPRDAPP